MGILIEQELEVDELGSLIAEQIDLYEIPDLLQHIYSRLPIGQRAIFAKHCKAFGESRLVSQNSVRGKVFVLTGDFDLGKKYWHKYIQNKSGLVKSSITHDTDYVIKESGKLDGTRSLKEKDANRLGIPVISINDFKKFV